MEIQTPESLLDRTYQLLSERTLSLREIAEQTKLDESWLAKFHRKVIPDPSVNKVQRLHDYLVDQKGA